MRPVLGCAVVAAIGCGGDRAEPGAGPGPAPPAPVAAAAPADTMVLGSGGYAIWLTAGRAATDTAGAPCRERGVEIRTDTSRVLVPLLFTTRPPTLLDREHLRAELTLRCRVIGVYRVDLATGRPIKVADR